MTSQRYTCKLSPELLEKAVTELNEPRDNDERLKAIDQLRNSYDVEKYGALSRDDDVFILRFLRAKKFDQKKALTVLQNYHSVRKEYKEVFDKVDMPSILKPIGERGILLMLNGQDKDGAAVMVNRNTRLTKDDNLKDLMAYGIVCMEKLLEDEKYSICGISTIDDMDDFSLSFLTRVSLKDLGNLTKLWQDAMPLRYKHLHVVNEGSVYDFIMAIVKPFLKKKFLSRFHTHGRKLQSLHTYIDPSILPPFLGGTGPEADSLAQIWYERIAEDFPQDTAL